MFGASEDVGEEKSHLGVGEAGGVAAAGAPSQTIQQHIIDDDGSPQF
jgi:hypothetical protein